MRTRGPSCGNLWAARPIKRIICGPNESKAGVAQAVEQRIRNAWVGGSNPSTGIPDFHFDPTRYRRSRLKTYSRIAYNAGTFIVRMSPCTTKPPTNTPYTFVFGSIS